MRITETNMAKVKNKSTKKARSAAMRNLSTLSEKMKQFPDLCAEMDLSCSDDEDSIISKTNTAAIAPPLSPMKKPQSTKRQVRSSPTRQPADGDNNINLSSMDDSLKSPTEMERDDEAALKPREITFNLEGKDEWRKASNEVETMEATTPTPQNYDEIAPK